MLYVLIKIQINFEKKQVFSPFYTKLCSRMSTVAEKLHKWAIQELNLASESGLNGIPDVESLRLVTKGKYRRVWTYVTDHVRSKTTVDKIRHTLYLKKLIEEKEDTAHLNDDSTDVAKLQAAILKATEKRAYLLGSLSTVKDRILSIEQKVQNIRDETFQINQKTVLLELLKQQYDAKNINLKVLLSQISACKNSLCAYQSAKVCDKTVLALPYEYLYENKAINNQNYCRAKILIKLTSSMYQSNFCKEYEIGKKINENLQSNIYEFKKNGLLLTDFVFFLKEISGSDVQEFAIVNAQSSPTKDFMFNETKESKSSKDLLAQMKCDNVYNSLASVKFRRQIKKLLVMKNKFFEDKVKNSETELYDLDFEVKCTLFEKRAENNALTKCNSYIEDYLKHLSDKTHSVIKKNRQQNLWREELGHLIQTFYNDADLTFFLFYTFSDTFQKTIDKVNGLQSFAYNELFELPFPQKECVRELKSCLVGDRKLTWAYSAKNNIIQPLFPDPYQLLSSSEVQNCLNFQPFQNICTLCENWVQFKQKVRTEIIARSVEYVTNYDINVSELYAKMLKVLDAMKFSIQNATLAANDGMSCCHRNKSLIQEWWEQNAQYIPDIEYEGKTFEMWINILSVLTDFEPPNYV